MAKKTIDASAIRKITAELDCHPDTVRKVFRLRAPTDRPIGKKIFEALVRDGYLDPLEEAV